MAPLTFADTHNMVAFLSKSDISAGFDQVVDFLNAHVIYAKRIAWNEFSCSMASAVICLATGVETPLFVSMPVQPQPWAEGEKEEVDMPTDPTPPSPTNVPSPIQHAPTPTPHTSPHASPTQHQPTEPSESSIPFLNTLLETWRINDDNAATKNVNAVEHTVFDDEEVTMTIAQKLIKMKAEKAKLLDEQIAKRGMTYDKVRPIFKREYKKVQTMFKPDKDVEKPQKKRVAEETLLQESFKKLKAVKVSGSKSTQGTPTNDPKEMSEEDVHNMLEIILVSKRSKKHYSLSNGVMTLMLSAKLQVEEDSEMARDLVMKIFMKANQPKRKSLDTSSK
nr:hypothetical protein [Tanacetum cinerariifolium]